MMTPSALAVAPRDLPRHARSASSREADALLDLLITGQSTVRCLLARYRVLCEQKTASDAQRGGLARRLCAELAVQLRIEDEVFYPALRSALSDGHLVDLAEVEHECLRDLLERVVEMAPTDPLFDARLLVIGELFELHLARETQQLHPAARRSAQLDFDDLALQLVQRRDDLLAELADGHSPRFENEEADPVGEPPR